MIVTYLLLFANVWWILRDVWNVQKNFIMYSSSMQVFFPCFIRGQKGTNHLHFFHLAIIFCYCVVEIRAWILEVACCEFCSKFPPLHLTVWTVCSKSEATPSIYWSLGKSPLFFLWRFGLSDFVSVIIREQKGLRKRDYLEKCPGPLNKFPRNWFLHNMISWERHDALHVFNKWLHTVQMVNTGQM